MKEVLLDCAYLVIHRSPYLAEIHKLTPKDEDRVSYEVKNGICSCRAGQFGNDCKHVQMAQGSLKGPLVSRRRALQTLRFVLRNFEEIRDLHEIVRLTPKTREVRRVEATAWVRHSDSLGSSYEFWGSRDTIVRIRCFTDEQVFQKVVDKCYPPPPQELGKTYTGCAS